MKILKDKTKTQKNIRKRKPLLIPIPIGSRLPNRKRKHAKDANNPLLKTITLAQRSLPSKEDPPFKHQVALKSYNLTFHSIMD